METTIDGARIHYEIHGDGEPLLLVHGYPLSGRMWDGVVRRLGGEYRLIVPDLRGFGRSDATTPTGMARYADDLAALLDAAGERRPVVLAGFSMGGYVAFEFLRRYGDRVRALALVGTRAAQDTPEAAARRVENAERVLREGVGFIADENAVALFAAGTPQPLKDEWREIMAETSSVGIAAALHAMAERPDSFPALRDFDRPVLVVVGEEDALTPPPMSHEMAEVARDARLVEIAGAGHLAPVEQPAAVAQALGDFLRSLPPLG
jgi:pimeloyl-ACP methyl ester carboxylesterase